MFDAILFDLDGTLLPMDTDLFLEKYLTLLSQATKTYIEPEFFVDKLMKSTYAMISNLESNKTNEEVFLESFFDSPDLSPEKLLPIFDDFYRTDFKKLSPYFPPHPLVPKIVNTALAQSPVVIATNPVFPRIAIEERLTWAGVEDQPYALITSYEVMHFCKPQIEYYMEITEMLNIPPEKCLMIGNDVEEDLVAAEIGMKTFLVDDFIINRRNIDYRPDYRGNLRDLFLFLNNDSA